MKYREAIHEFITCSSWVQTLAGIKALWVVTYEMWLQRNRGIATSHPGNQSQPFIMTPTCSFLFMGDHILPLKVETWGLGSGSPLDNLHLPFGVLNYQCLLLAVVWDILQAYPDATQMKTCKLSNSAILFQWP